ncbi:MAG TPA: laminin B domain-containing protein [Catalimonadaceae bacterium]|nr:laminin B domain-containing protein [Catalimonadaceae bacterium]
MKLFLLAASILIGLHFRSTCLAQQSRFSQTSECWTLTGDGDGPFQKSTGGNPGGFIEAVDQNIRESWYWNAPLQFLYNKSRSIGKFMRFDIRTTHPGNSRLTRNVIMEGAGLSIGAAMPNLPGTNWTHNDIALVASNWHYTSTDVVVSQSDFLAVMTSLTRIRILGEYSPSVDRGGLDNFILEPEGTIEAVMTNPCGPFCFNFKDRSVGNPIAWKWSFPGASTPQSYLQNPSNICYSQPGTYSVELISKYSTCYSDTLGIQLIVKSNPTVFQNLTICEGSQIQLPGGKWISDPGIYRDTLKTSFGCDSILVSTVRVKVPQFTNLTRILCFGQSTTIGDTSFATTGQFIRILKTPEGCDSTINLLLTVLPQKTGFRKFTICTGETVQDGDTIYKSAGTFTRTLRSKETGCDSLHTSEIEVISIDLVSSRDTTVDVGTTVKLFAFSQAKNLSYRWFSEGWLSCDSCQQTESTIWRNTRFFVSATDTLYGCSAEKSILIKVHCPIEIPNLVTLNSDNWNDYFYLKHQTCLRKINHLIVYDRWGKMIMDRTEYPEGYAQAVWQPQQPGVYFYWMEVDLFEGETKSFNGWIEVLK